MANNFSKEARMEPEFVEDIDVYALHDSLMVEKVRQRIIYQLLKGLKKTLNQLSVDIHDSTYSKIKTMLHNNIITLEALCAISSSEELRELIHTANEKIFEVIKDSKE